MTEDNHHQAQRTFEAVRVFKWISFLCAGFLFLWGFPPGAWAFLIAGVALWGLEKAR